MEGSPINLHIASHVTLNIFNVSLSEQFSNIKVYYKENINRIMIGMD